jgi:hypothetical protein
MCPRPRPHPSRLPSRPPSQPRGLLAPPTLWHLRRVGPKGLNRECWCLRRRRVLAQMEGAAPPAAWPQPCWPCDPCSPRPRPSQCRCLSRTPLRRRRPRRRRPRRGRRRRPPSRSPHRRRRPRPHLPPLLHPVLSLPGDPGGSPRLLSRAAPPVQLGCCVAALAEPSSPRPTLFRNGSSVPAASHHPAPLHRCAAAATLACNLMRCPPP